MNHPLSKTLLLILLSLTGCMQLLRQAGRGLSRPDREPERQPHVEQAAIDVPVRPGHPRLFTNEKTTFQASNDPFHWAQQLKTRADGSLGNAPIAYSRQKLLVRSRDAVRRISLLAGVYQMTREQRYADAAKAELLNVCNFPDWQPTDFLATAEMMTAVSIGYDWLFDVLSPEDRKIVVRAIAEKGLTPALTAYASDGGWTTAHHNWNLVCNGGVIVASLAIMEEAPALARRTLAEAMSSIKNGLETYDANGGTAEGPMYHNYATRYLTFAAAALECAPLKPISFATEQPNWTKASNYRVQLTGPGGKSFNFGDCDEVVGNSAWLVWHGAHFQNASATEAGVHFDGADPSMFDQLWYVPNSTDRRMPYAAVFDAAITLRSPSDAGTFLALRKGSNASNHNHLDLGTFVLDMQGQRFAADLGADNYDLPGYLTDRRADYLRSSTPGHNTLTISNSSNASQSSTASATGEIVSSDRYVSVARIDLTNAYPQAESITRTATVGQANTVTIQDDIRLKNAASFTWNLHTPARVTPMRGGLLLELNGKRVQLIIREPANVGIDAMADQTPPPELPVVGMTHIRIVAPTAKQTRFDIEFRNVP